MSHLTNEEIILSYYDEPEPGLRREHIAECEECRAELARLAAVLDRVRPGEAPEPEPGYEQRVWDRVSWRLRAERRGSRNAMVRWLAAAAVLALAFVAGVLWNRRAPVAAPQVAVAQSPAGAAAGRDRVLLLVVGEHFEESERVLVELTNLTPEGGTDIRTERQRAEALLASNRLYRHTVKDRGEQGVATLLDELEPVLLQIARSPDQLTEGELRSMQKRVEARGLVFKIRVVRAGMRATSSSKPKQNV